MLYLDNQTLFYTACHASCNLDAKSHLKLKSEQLLSPIENGWRKENKKKKEGKRKANSTRCSRAVTHHSTNQARLRLTSVIGREPVHSQWYDRWRKSTHTLAFILSPINDLEWMSEWVSEWLNERVSESVETNNMSQIASSAVEEKLCYSIWVWIITACVCLCEREINSLSEIWQRLAFWLLLSLIIMVLLIWIRLDAIILKKQRSPSKVIRCWKTPWVKISTSTNFAV